jgi:hypothetical protein
LTVSFSRFPWEYTILERVSIEVRKLIRDKILGYGFVDAWVCANLILLIILSSTCSALNLHWGQPFADFAVIYGGLRVWEVIIYQINVLFFDEYRAKDRESTLRKKGITYVTYALRSYRRVVILSLLNYLEIVFWFALFYHNLNGAFETGKASLDFFPAAVHFSLVTMTGFGNTSISPQGPLGYALTSIQIAIGLFMVVVIIARFIALLPKPKTMDEFER